jgi:hypothetical protein
VIQETLLDSDEEYKFFLAAESNMELTGADLTRDEAFKRVSASTRLILTLIFLKIPILKPTCALTFYQAI